MNLSKVFGHEAIKAFRADDSQKILAHTIDTLSIIGV